MFLALAFGDVLGGEGLLEYSVKDNELTFKLGVLGREFTPLTVAITGPSMLSSSSCDTN